MSRNDYTRALAARFGLVTMGLQDFTAELVGEGLRNRPIDEQRLGEFRAQALENLRTTYAGEVGLVVEVDDVLAALAHLEEMIDVAISKGRRSPDPS